MALVSELHETYPSDCPYVRAVRAEYAGWNWTMSHGYIRYNKGARGAVLEHRAVAELVHGIDDAGLASWDIYPKSAGEFPKPFRSYPKL